jgi:type IV secretion system protein VirB10
MRAAAFLLAVFLGVANILVSAQNWDSTPQLKTRAAAPAAQENSQTASGDSITVPSGTRVPLIMKQGLTTKNARPGDPVYAQTSFPIVLHDRIVIPPGTFVQGEILRVLRPGKVKGRAELQMGFTSMIFPSGYTLLLGGAVQGTPGDSNTAGVKGKEGTIQGDSSKGKDVGTIVGTAVPGAGIGAIAGGSKAAGIGALSGGALGLATVLLTRGPEIQLAVGDSIEMVLERNITIDETKAHASAQ